MKNEGLTTTINIFDYQKYLNKMVFESEYNSDYAVNVEKHSYFDVNIIKEVIEDLVNLYENEEYSCVITNHNTYKYKTGMYGSYLDEVTDKVLIVTKKENVKSIYSDISKNDNCIDNLINKGDTFVVQRSETAFIGNYIYFYSVKGNILTSTVDYQRFTYVKDFIDFVIGYKIFNKMNDEDISIEQLKYLLSVYIESCNINEKDNYSKKRNKCEI